MAGAGHAVGRQEIHGGYSIADIANQPFYLIAVGVMVIALLLSLVMIQNEKQLPRGMRPE